ncbi:putative membrane protein [Legionella massiliensis]|uniref:Putative membrane protein n=1 Tax=Legionella massiliensis TaxID=1034943 RepID=A0A078L1Z1_9GAMM|nr:exopolysaccharide Pel transporter PelG [Legionella massiliensis]CDZ78059.1 putative membrane protein [Legionella massiliensis]CEE13797.1 hypothetical protein BN1094_02356 [Legionella massiliensis]
MAGIGFELRKLANTDSFWKFLRSQLYAGILSNGAWIISIGILIAIYFVVNHFLGPKLFAVQFLVAVTYLVASSLIVSGIFQHSLNRFISDRIFEKKYQLIRPNFIAAILYLSAASTVIGYLSAEFLLFDQPLAVKLLMASSFVLLNIIWVFSNAFAGLKKYRFLLFSFFLGYVTTFLLAVYLYQYELSGLLFSFYIGQVILAICLFIFMLKTYPSNYLFSRRFLHFMKLNPALVYSGFFFYLGLWIDKLSFWFSDNTSTLTLGALRASPLYDMPVFISFLLMIPGISTFFYEVEANFSRYFHRYYDAIREGATLEELNKKHAELVVMARNCILNTLKIQGGITLFAILLAPEILALLKLAPIYVYLLRITTVAAFLLVLLIAQLNLFFYLDMARNALYLTIIFFFLNFALTYLTLYLGPLYFGYGFAMSLLFTNLIAVISLRESFRKLSYYSFMSN